ncbi:MAG: hypothetical protein IPM69_03020 [Ignavibacteria bacterium]|nr:hypothetical protein [Ignavibacteria bacterium]
MHHGSIGKILTFVGIFILVLSQNSFAQGFDWQYSSRLPSPYPRLFLGGSISGIYAFHTADIYSLGEEYRCGDYKKGIETGMTFSGVGEYWVTGMVAVQGMIGYKTSTTRFTAETEPEPFRRNGEEFELIREFAMDVYQKVLSIEAVVKYRIERTHAHLGVGIKTDFVLASTAEQTETILSPVEFTQSIKDPNGIQPLNGFQGLLLSPLISAGYDAELGKGFYATPRISISLPLMNKTSAADWTSIDISGGISILLSF